MAAIVDRCADAVLCLEMGAGPAMALHADRDREYRERRQRLLNGDRESLWPEHTWKMRMYCDTACEGPTPKWPLMFGPLPPS